MDYRHKWLTALREKAGESDKSWWVTLALSVLFGCFGVDRFYLDQPVPGFVKLCTFGLFGLWWLLDLILLFTNHMKDGHGGIVRRPF